MPHDITRTRPATTGTRPNPHLLRIEAHAIIRHACRQINLKQDANAIEFLERAAATLRRIPTPATQTDAPDQ